MSERCILYSITDRHAFPGDENSKRQQLLTKILELVRAGVDYVQLREKDLSARELELTARSCVTRSAGIFLRTTPSSTRPQFLINSRSDVAIAAGAAGVHLPSRQISPDTVRCVWKQCSATKPIISVACHSLEDVEKAAEAKVEFALLAPIFGKRSSPAVQPLGLEVLRSASRLGVQVIALGGVTMANARSCLDAGAAGIAGISLFQENDIHLVVRSLRGI